MVKSSKFFCNLEKQHYAAKSMEKLITDEGVEINDIKDILHEQELFYTNLYTAKIPRNQTNLALFHDRNNQFFKNFLTDMQSENLESNITLAECSGILFKMKL